MSEVPSSVPSTPSAAPSTSSSAPSAAPSAPVPTGASDAAAAATPTPNTANNASLPYQDAADPTKAPTDASASSEAAKAEARKYKFKGKVNGKEIERELADEELNLYLQKGFGADEKFNEAATVRKQARAFLKAFKDDPFGAVKDPEIAKFLGGEMDLLEMAGKRLYEMIEADEMKKADPVKYEMEQLRKRVETFEAKEKAAAEAKQKQQETEFYQRKAEETTKSWAAELEKNGLSGNKAMIYELAKIADVFDRNGLDLNPAHLVAELKNNLAEQKKVVMGGLKGKDLLGFLGEDVVKEILNTKLEELKGGKPVQEPIKAAEPTPAPAENEEKAPKMGRALRSWREFQTEERE